MEAMQQKSVHKFMPSPAVAATVASTTSSTSAGSGSVAKKRARTFHRKYLESCKKRNAIPVAEIKEKSKNVLDFVADRIKLDDWPSIMKALIADDGALRCLAIRLRKSYTHGNG